MFIKFHKTVFIFNLASHCVEDWDLLNVIAVLGAHDHSILEPSQVRVTVLPPNVIIHPLYNRNTLVNDVAVLRLPYAVGWTSRIQPIRIPNGAELLESFAGELSMLSGFGVTETGDRSNVLRYIRHSIITNLSCNIRWPILVTASNICSSTDGKNQYNFVKFFINI